MKTPRQILFQQHETVEPKLDAIRHLVLANVTNPTTPTAEQRTTTRLRDMLLPLRWHLAGLSAAWLTIALLNTNPLPTVTAAINLQNIPSPRALLAEIRENRRKLWELMEWPVTEPAAVPSRGAPQRRGALQTFTALA